MAQSTIAEKMTPEEKAFLLAFEANELDKVLKEKRDELDPNCEGCFSRFEKLERYSANAQKRLNRRYSNLQMRGM